MRGHNGHHLEARDRETEAEKKNKYSANRKRNVTLDGLLAVNQSNKKLHCAAKKKSQRNIIYQSPQAIILVYLFAAAPADSSSVLDASPQLVSLLEEAGKLLPPALAQRPWKNLILALLLILLHGVGKIPRGGAHEPNLGLQFCQQWHTRFTFSLKITRVRVVFLFETHSAMNKFFLVYSAIVKQALLKYTKVMARRY